MWEYNRFEFRFRNFPDLNTELKRLGKEGWEVIYYNETESTKLNGEYKASMLIKRFVP
jgi:hypothetical protein